MTTAAPSLYTAPRVDLMRMGMRADVLAGLRSRPKTLPSKYFYDAAGSALFERITTLAEYYLTRTELSIMEKHVPEMTALIGPRCLLIEYGSGSCAKTRMLLEHLRAPAGYVPIDISGPALHTSAQRLMRQYPHLVVHSLCADFTDLRSVSLPDMQETHRVVYFPGSTIGNLTPIQAKQLLRQTARLVGHRGGLLLGVDLQKDRRTLESAYNDRQGITAAFNRNILVRINRELAADFNLERFVHRALYNSALGRIEMHLMSDRFQQVAIGNPRIAFAGGETICTEYSYKYKVEDLEKLARAAGLCIDRMWTDDRRYFAVVFLRTA
jgi:L-histidine Nalpha-methyltransferase